jgi:SAM-dependent methyltransferase
MKLVNLGCGNTFHSDWVNVDLISGVDEIVTHDIRQKLPYPDQFFDVCYSSHVLEHLKPLEADSFLLECWRILRPGGIVRIVVPDLEGIVRIYLSLLEELKLGNKTVEENYNWIMLELYDQSVRTSLGGEMKEFLMNPNLSNKDFILSRIGQEATGYWESNSQPRTFWQKMENKSFSWWFAKSRLLLTQLLVKIVGGKEIEQSFKEGVVRKSGVIHQWMYDAFSLERALKKAGFTDIKICQADESRILDFNSYQLDTIEGKVRKPDSLFMEGIKS